MFFLYNITLLPMADVYSMMHCHFMSTCGILCLCTLFVFFHAFPSFPSVSPSPHLCSPCTLWHSLTFHHPVRTWWVWVCLCGCTCMCVDQLCVHVSTTHVWLTGVEWGSCIVMVAYPGCTMYVHTCSVIHAVFPTTEADHDFATEELGEDQRWWRCDPIPVCWWSTSD